MAEHTPGYATALAAAEHEQYVRTLAGQLAQRHPALLTPQLALPLLRVHLALITRLLTTPPTSLPGATR